MSEPWSRTSVPNQTAPKIAVSPLSAKHQMGNSSVTEARLKRKPTSDNTMIAEAIDIIADSTIFWRGSGLRGCLYLFIVSTDGEP